ncbi:protein SIEVE ELEMENT OCCLUSION C-like [Glycine soja]|uniref:Protein SIEVE ELEMENT OCCLUSION C n=1 Tax=Glycine soja TaxID=3848 RepID=A0A445HHQ5_GLYSO|nr:protein SIEVE ELEMENT OCCLUSION C-like [Glycine soja]RZB73235.1 Protein SIEVE ELEMENT OCCLUSION C [Glycine soja]
MQHDILIKKLLLTHDPDGRRLDSETMLLAVGNIMFHTSTIIGAFNLYSASFQKNDITEIETIGCSEPVGFIITKIGKVLCRCSGEGDINSRIINLFDLIGKYSWDAKVVLVLAAFAVRYGEFWQLKQLYRGNALAALISNIKQLPNNLKPLKLQIKALSLLVKTMMDVAKCIIKFEYLPLQHVEPGNDIFLVRDTKSRIYEAAYWITRSCLACFSQVMDFTAKKHDQVYSDSAIIAAWELSSLAYRLSGICCNLRRQVDLCHKELERNLYDRLLDLAREENIDNQKTLTLFFPSKNYLPLKDCSTEVKLRGSELKNKTVLLLISKPQLLNPIDIYLLVQQTCDHPLNERLRESYKIVWIPLPSSDTWTEAEERSFNFMSDSLPWNAVRKPRLLSSAVVKYIREQWNYKDEPIMVALDSKGKVTNYNALDMINIWGAQAYPFSASKEEELWQDQNLTMQLLLDGINPLLAYWVEQGKNICLYGSENLVWIQQFNDKITEIKRAGLQLETIYVGNSQSGENVKQIMARGGEKSLSDPLSFTNVQHFWVRLETMRRSKLRLGKTPSSDHVLAELSTLLDMDDREEGWAVIGCGGSSSTDILRLQGMQVMEFLRKCSEWRENITNLGLHGALRNFLDPHFVEGSCNHSYFVSSRENERPSQGTVMCQVCKRPMKNFVVYQP